MNKKDIPFLAENLNNMFPDAKTELYYNNEFQLLIAILMSAQATDKQVNKVNKIFFEHLTQPSDAKNIGLQKVKNYIQSISFFNNKATNILRTCEILETQYNSIPPKTIDELTKLP
jgi:endonuclease-3